MRFERLLWKKASGWSIEPTLSDATLVLYFGGREPLASTDHYQSLRDFYPSAHILGCTTGGEIYGGEVYDDAVVAVAIHFAATSLQAASIQIKDIDDSYHAGQTLAQTLNRRDLKSVFVLSDGTNVNGSELVRGLYKIFDDKVIVTGGLAGDGADFKYTQVGLNRAPQHKQIAAVGFYGDALRVSYGSVGGWSRFGPDRFITRSNGNILYELDGKPALDLYKQYLGDEAMNLPTSGLFFPLSIRPTAGSKHEIVRTILSANEADKSLTYAGNIPTGYIAQLMRGNHELLIDGALQAAGLADGNATTDGLAILVSCIGRKLLLGQSISDETEAVTEVLGPGVPTIGFYSYGEICHQNVTGKCDLHNQTMTITVLHED